MGNKNQLCPTCSLKHQIARTPNLASNNTQAQVIHIQLKGKPTSLHSEFFHDFEDIDAFEDFFDNLHDDECSIIERHGKNLKVLRALKNMADIDINETAKALEIEG